MNDKKVYINITMLPYYENYPNFLDISDKFKYKRLQLKSLSCEASATSDIISSIK